MGTVIEVAVYPPKGSCSVSSIGYPFGAHRSAPADRITRHANGLRRHSPHKETSILYEMRCLATL